MFSYDLNIYIWTPTLLTGGEIRSIRRPATSSAESRRTTICQCSIFNLHFPDMAGSPLRGDRFRRVGIVDRVPPIGSYQ